MPGFKVRLGDGSQIGPLDVQMLRSWYQQGLIGTESPVLRPGAGRWVPLAQAVDVREWEGPARRSPGKAPRAAAARSTAAEPTPRLAPSAWRGRWRLPPAARYGLSALLVLAVAAAAYRFVASRGAVDDEVRPWLAEEPRFADESLGIAFEPPRGWALLRHDNPLVTVPPEASAVLVQSRRRGSAFLVVDPAPRGIASLERYRESLLEQRRRANGTYKVGERAPAAVASLPGLRASATWQAGGKDFRETTVVWRDGWTHLGLVAWFPGEQAGSIQDDVTALLSGFSTTGVLAQRFEQAVSRAAAEAPHLTPDVVRRLMGQSEAGALEPEETFRRASQAAGAGMAALAAAEVREMSQLTNQLYGTVPARDRGRLGAYLERLKARSLTSPDLDREMCGIMKGAVLRLPEARRSRFRALYEKAVHAGLDNG